MKQQFLHLLLLAVLTLLIGLAASSTALATATITIQNNDAAGTGFNDPTPVAPVGGNSGTTLGEQRLIAFQFAAGIWGATLNSGPTITIRANWSTSMPCTATSGTLASAGSVGSRSNFPNAPFADTWYLSALANALSGSDSNLASPEINTTVNARVGTTGCLENSGGWYLGLDGNHGNSIELVTVLLHEYSHGLGFQTLTSLTTGLQSAGLPTIYDRFLRDNSTGKTWNQMTNGERVASAINSGNLVWSGANTIADVPSVLGRSPTLRVNSPPPIAGSYTIGTAVFGPPVSSPGVTADVSATVPADGCSALSNGGSVNGRIAFIDRGTCNFTVKVRNAQDAGALAVIIGNVPDSLDPTVAPAMGGTDGTIVIPSVSLNLADANTFRNQLGGGINASVILDPTRFAGADGAGRPLMFSPNPVQTGSSVSHFDSSAFPNQLMEPNDSSDLTHSVMPPQDLTLSLLRDLGWTAGTTATSTVQLSAPAYNASESSTSVTITITRTGDTSGTDAVDISTSDTDNFTVNCGNIAGNAFARCDFATSVDTLTFAPGETSKTFAIPIINDSIAEGSETFGVTLSNVTGGATLGAPATATVTITDNDAVTGPNPIFTTPFFVRQHYLDFLSREPEVGEPWSGVLNGCSDVNNNPACDRLTVSGSFFGSPEFQLKGLYVYRFYKLAFNRLPLYSEIVVDMRAVTGTTPAETFQKKATFTNNFVARTEFVNLFNGQTNTQYVNTLMGRYSLTSITTPDPANPDGATKVTLTTADLINRLNGVGGTLTRAQVLRAIADSDQVGSCRVESGVCGDAVLRISATHARHAGFNSWLNHLNANPTDFRTMVNGFMNSAEYRLAFRAAELRISTDYADYTD